MFSKISEFQSKKNKSLSERLYQNYRVLLFMDLLRDLAFSLDIDIINKNVREDLIRMLDA